jgi:hypothetical protein
MHITCPFNPVTIFGIGSEFYDGTFLTLPIIGGDMRRQPLGPGTKLNNNYAQFQRTRYCFDITCRLGYYGYRAAVERIAELQINNAQFNLVTIRDFMYPQQADIAAAVAGSSQAFTTRTGIIEPASINSSAGKANPINLADVHTLDGFTFVFEESTRR